MLQFFCGVFFDYAALPGWMRQVAALFRDGTRPSPGAPPVRVLVADDHPVVRDGLVAMLDAHPDVCVVGEAADGLEAVARS